MTAERQCQVIQHGIDVVLQLFSPPPRHPTHLSAPHRVRRLRTALHR
jgi:hypothetical protein